MKDPKESMILKLSVSMRQVKECCNKDKYEIDRFTVGCLLFTLILLVVHLIEELSNNQPLFYHFEHLQLGIDKGKTKRHTCQGMVNLDEYLEKMRVCVTMESN